MSSAVPARTWTVFCVRVSPALVGVFCGGIRQDRLGGRCLLAVPVRVNLTRFEFTNPLAVNVLFRLFATMLQCKTRRGSVADNQARDQSCPPHQWSGALSYARGECLARINISRRNMSQFSIVEMTHDAWAIQLRPLSGVERDFPNYSLKQT